MRGFSYKEKGYVENMTVNQFIYGVFGLVVASEFPLSGLSSGEGRADVTIRYGIIPEFLENIITKGVRFQVAEGEFLLKVDGVARYLVLQGQEIIVEPYPEASPYDVQTFLLGSVFSALLQQRGCLVLHGSAVVINGQSVIFSGASGAGKSTLAAAFAQRGYEVLTDDVCAITFSPEGVPAVIPGYPRLKLWADAAEKLGEDTYSLRPVRLDLEKYEWPLPQQSRQTSVPVARLYQLSTTNDSEIILTTLKSMEQMETLINNTYRYRFLEGQKAIGKHFKQCSLLAKAIRVGRISRPKGQFLLDELVTLLEKDLGL